MMCASSSERSSTLVLVKCMSRASPQCTFKRARCRPAPSWLKALSSFGCSIDRYLARPAAA
eukprot:15431751-Alexandrium_andersonii.AAC.1